MKKKIKIRRLIWIVIPLLAILLIWVGIRIEDWGICRGRIVTVSNDTCQIQTRYYNLNCPAEWKGKISVETEPMEEEYGGDPVYLQHYVKGINPANYSLRIIYTADGADAVIGEVQMYAYLEDCQQLKHWDYVGCLSVNRDNWYDSQLIVQYPKIKGGDEVKAQVKKMRGTLPKILANLQPREQFLRRRDAHTWVGWTANDDPKDHGQTWAQREDEEYRIIERDYEKWKQGQKVKFSSYDDNSAPTAPSNRSTYKPDPYDVNDYDDPEDFADDRLEDFSDSEGEDDEDEAWEEAYDYWEENHRE